MSRESSSINLHEYLQLYSKVYPRYIGIRWENYEDGFAHFQTTINYLFFYMPYFIGIPQALLNLTVLTTVILIIKHPLLATNATARSGRPTIPRSTIIQIVPRFHRAAFIFIGNLALADLGLVFSEFVASYLELQVDRKLENDVLTDDFDNDHLLEFDSMSRNYCRIQVLIWLFFTCASLCAAVLLTLDRFIYIMYGLRYLSIVTSKFIKISLALIWFISAGLSLTSFLLSFIYEEKEDDPECFFGHRMSRILLIFIFCLLVLIIIFFYIAYIPICSKATIVTHKNERTLTTCKESFIMKRLGATRQSGSRSASKKISVASQSSGTRRSSITANNHLPSSRQRKAGMYVMILLVILTFSWLPFIILNIHDFHVHNSDIQGLLKLNNCSDEEQVLNFQDIPKMPVLSFQECLFESATTRRNCSYLSMISSFNVTLSKESICEILVKTFHGKMQDLILKMSLMVAMLNSIVNPIIYAFWYSQFRLRIVRAWAFCLHRQFGRNSASSPSQL